MVYFGIWRFIIWQCICNGIFPGKSWLTFLHWCTHNQSLQSWLHDHHFPPWCSFHPHFHTGMSHTDVDIWWRKTCHKECPEGGMSCCPHHLSDVLLQYKNHVIHIPMPFLEAWQLWTKGPSGCLIPGSFRAPCHYTSINMFELFFGCTIAYQYIYW